MKQSKTIFKTVLLGSPQGGNALRDDVGRVLHGFATLGLHVIALRAMTASVVKCNPVNGLALDNLARHCERSEAIQDDFQDSSSWIATGLKPFAMT